MLTLPEGPPPRAWCLFRIEARPYAVGLESVAEVVEVEGLVRLPLGSKRVLGLCVFHRDVVPVIALDAATGTAAGLPHPDPRPLVLILRSEAGIWALRIDRGGTIVAEAPLEDENGPRPHKPGGPTLRGTVRVGGTPHAVLDPEATWCDLRDAFQRGYRGDRGPSPSATAAHAL
jgi:purine-binding chemotaxis protein CheW